MMRLLLTLFLFFPLFFAGVYSDVKTFETDYVKDGYRFTVTTDINMEVRQSLVASSRIIEGDPTTADDDVFCPSSSVVFLPSSTGSWATRTVDVFAPYSSCGGTGEYCPLPSDLSSSQMNNDIVWLSESEFNVQKIAGFSNLISDYTTLSPFADISGTFYFDQSYRLSPNAERRDLAGVQMEDKNIPTSIICKGKLNTYLNGALIRSQDASSVSSVNILRPETEGTLTAETRLEDVECFAVTSKTPLDLEDNPSTPYDERSRFVLFYYTRIDPFADDVAAATNEVTTVQFGDGTCGFNSVDVEMTLLDEFGFAAITVENTGNLPIKITGVESITSGFAVESYAPFCFWPPCPTSGFDEEIFPGESKILIVKVTPAPDPSERVFVRLNAITTQPDCGGEILSCDREVQVNGPRGGIPGFCTISPATEEVVQNEAKWFYPTCFRMLGGVPTPVACSGSWSLDGLDGGFLPDSTTSAAHPYFTSSPGTSGRVVFDAGDFSCSADVSVADDPLGSSAVCDLTPDSASLAPGETQGFNVACTVDGSEQTPMNTDYLKDASLDGSFADETPTSVNFEAGMPSTGNVYSVSTLTVGGRLRDIVDLSPVTVGDGGCVGPDCPDSGEEVCVLNDGVPLDVPVGYSGWIPVECRDSDPCPALSWSATGGVVLSDSDSLGTSYTVTGSGFIEACVSSDNCCSLPVTGRDLACWELS